MLPKLGYIFHACFFTCVLGPREPLIQLAYKMETGGGWGLHRTFDTWVLKQDWRLPLEAFTFEVDLALAPARL